LDTVAKLARIGYERVIAARSGLAQNA
jgi:hypothetical protein